MVVQSKHFVSSPSLVTDSLQGICVLNPNISLDVANKVVHIANQNRARVALLCGGGSGHEPSHAGFVGEGILTAAVCGSVFASPNSSQVRRAIDLIDNDKGTIIIVKNYTGDVLNFGLAKEQYSATHPDKAGSVKFLVVGDDVAVGRTQGHIVGRRGLAGVCLVYKVAGALATLGGSLDEVYEVAQYVSSRLGTIGVGLEHCHVPGTSVQDNHLRADEIEIGLGIHNESGNSRISPIPPLNKLVPDLLQLITSTTDPERAFVPFRNDGNDEVVLLVNNLGGLSELELGAIVNETKRALDHQRIKVRRVLAGTFMTSLNMPGFSLTLLLLPRPDDKNAPPVDLLLVLLDDKTDAPGWRWSPKTEPARTLRTPERLTASTPLATSDAGKLRASNVASFNTSVEHSCRALIAAEPEITKMDSIAGDGDCGLTLKDGANGVLKALEEGKVTGEDVIGSMIAVSKVAEEAMGGTSGALYSIFFSALAQGLSGPSTVATSDVWSGALNSALDRLYTYTRARPPSRTLVDPLAAFIETFPSGLEVAVKAAREAAEKTRDLEAQVGRSAYVEGGRLKAERVPDPGAWGVKVVIDALFAGSK
ncbi:dihydroxyacetone kinase [Pisolithus microcarpus]|nr:dihydroxyacetone kinase [Pisolithus microcarpus]